MLPRYRKHMSILMFPRSWKYIYIYTYVSNWLRRDIGMDEPIPIQQIASYPCILHPGYMDPASRFNQSHLDPGSRIWYPGSGIQDPGSNWLWLPPGYDIGMSRDVPWNNASDPNWLWLWLGIIALSQGINVVVAAAVGVVAVAVVVVVG